MIDYYVPGTDNPVEINFVKTSSRVWTQVIPYSLLSDTTKWLICQNEEWFDVKDRGFHQILLRYLKYESKGIILAFTVRGLKGFIFSILSHFTSSSCYIMDGAKGHLSDWFLLYSYTINPAYIKLWFILALIYSHYFSYILWFYDNVRVFDIFGINAA